MNDDDATGEEGFEYGRITLARAVTCRRLAHAGERERKRDPYRSSSNSSDDDRGTEVDVDGDRDDCCCFRR
jgi:hypothetical protein|tara:strand:- start:352 stop:564 length:213 start_codon:yes stop_codon:yes gene_type:complete